MMIPGEVVFTFTTGKKLHSTGNYDPEDNHLDVAKKGRDYPTRLDFRKKLVTSITFTPPTGRIRTWTTWEYFNHEQHVTDRFVNLG
jgi:hypothetical protein